MKKYKDKIKKIFDKQKQRDRYGILNAKSRKVDDD